MKYISVDINDTWILIRVTGYRFGKIHYFCAKVASCCGGQIWLFLAPKWHPGVNFTNILWVAFAPQSFWQTITNPNCKHLKTVQRTLVWLSISPIFYQQLFHTKVLCTPFMCLQVGFVIFWRKDFGAKAAHKMLVKLTPGVEGRSQFGETHFGAKTEPYRRGWIQVYWILKYSKVL